MKKITLLILLIAVGFHTGAAVPPYSWDAVYAPYDSIARILLSKSYNKELFSADNRYVAQLESIAQERNDPVLKARTLYWDVVTNQMAAHPDSCSLLLEEALRLLGNNNQGFDFASISYQLAGNYSRSDRLFEAYQLLDGAIPIFEKKQDYFFLGNAYHLMTLIFSAVNDKTMAMEYCKLSEESYREINYPLNKVYSLEAYLTDNATDGEKAIQLYKKAIEEDENDIPIVAQAYCNIAGIFVESGLPDSALYYTEKGIAYINEMKYPNTLLYVVLLMNKVNVDNQKGNNREALETLFLIDSLSQIHQNEAYIPLLNKFFSVVYSDLGNKEMAFDYLQKYQESFEEQVKSEEKLELQRMHTREAINRQQDQINILKQEADLKQSHIYIILLISAIVILAIVSVLIVIALRMRIRKTQNQRLQDSLDNEKLIAKINKENFEKDIEQKNREISSTVLLVANKNGILNQINNITRKYDDEGFLPNSYVKKINSVVEQSLKSDEEWDKLKMHFDLVHPHFFTKLKESSNELTENDLRLCAYIRIGMRAKEIANMLAVHPDSINSNRYRLRKKLNLDRDDSLDDFIRNI